MRSSLIQKTDCHTRQVSCTPLRPRYPGQPRHRGHGGHGGHRHHRRHSEPRRSR